MSSYSFDLSKISWSDFFGNPLIQLPVPNYLMTDPYVIFPIDSPDGLFHMFVSNIHYYPMFRPWRIRHFRSVDGIDWKLVDTNHFGSRPYILCDHGFTMIYESFTSPFQNGLFVRHSKNLHTWSTPHKILSSTKPWEKRSGFVGNISNGSLIKYKKEYRLYYSASFVFLPKLLVFEPLQIGVATSLSPDGPFIKKDMPIRSPDPSIGEISCGAMRVFPPHTHQKYWYAFTNSIRIWPDNTPRSAIYLMKSTDGFSWKFTSAAPVLSYGTQSWNLVSSYVPSYGEHEGVPLLYYNGRDGWTSFVGLTHGFPMGRERIGLAIGKVKL